MNKGVLIGVVTVAAAAVLAVAFLLGRASGSGTRSGQPAGGELAGGVVASPVPGPRALDQQAQPLPPPTPTAVSITEPAETRSAPGPAPAAIAGQRDSVGSDPARVAVAAYLDAVDQIQPGKMSGDAEGAANELAAALARGDTSGLDRMIRETEMARESLAAVSPPTPCAAHYRESLGSLDDALGMLRSLKTAMESSDPAALLPGVAARGAALRSRSEALQREELALRQRYGLTR
ncbi:MAG: hypothetical protein ACHQPI_01480 [Thermoanaerobaculia bacterium]